MHFYFNAAEKVNGLDDGSIQFKDSGRNRLSFTSVTVDSNGAMNYEVLLDDDTNEVPFMTANGVVLPDAVFFLGRKGNKKQLLKINL
jgi:hypothetical protein